MSPRRSRGDTGNVENARPPRSCVASPLHDAPRMKPRTLLGTTAVLAAIMMSNVAAADPTCWSIPSVPGVPSSGGSCCWEERRDVLGSPTNTNVVQAPSVVSDDGGTRFDVFAQGWDNAVWTRHFDGTTWSGWSSLGGVTTSRPTAVAAGPGHVYVFARGTDNAVWYRERTPAAWGPWRTIGGYILGGIGAAAWSSGEIEVFVHATDHALWKNSLSGTTASGWTSLGGSLHGEPSAGHVTHAGGGESLHVWVMASDGQVWRRTHDRVPKTIGFFTTWLDVWTGWKAQVYGTYGGVGLTEDVEPGFVKLAMRDAGGVVYAGFANSSGITALYDVVPPLRTRSDVSVAGSAPGEERYAFVDQDTAMVHVFHQEQVCSSCGDGRCYGAESASTCPSDCGTCGNGVCDAGETCSSCSDCGTCPAPTATCQDYKFCKKADLWAVTGTDVTGFGCTIVEARMDADKKAIGGILFDGPCPPAPSTCDGGTPTVAEWCCKDTGTTYFGVGCSEDEADDAAHLDESCDVWTAGICD